ncbi:MAG: VWA domain-containing protein [Deltaproteobacteria bacterium]|nr:VWA domain-containing protein [Deltaproteobacteria bacterium]
MKKIGFVLLAVMMTGGIARSQTSAPVPVAPAAPAADIQFIFDASGSMKAMMGTETQMDVAKKSLKQNLLSIPAGTPVSLCVYAHRIPKENKEQSCQDIEVVVPFQPLDPFAFAAKVDPLDPKGYTPIANSIRECAKAFTSKETKHTMILLSDGEETCGGDPIAEVKNLIAQGYQLTLHAIGFRVDANTKAQLAALATATGGSYFDADDAVTLGTHLAEATKKALFIEKPKEMARGMEIRGGNSFSDAVPLQQGIEYRLDHHQKPADYDYFYVDLKKGDRLHFAMSNQDKGLEKQGDKFVEVPSGSGGYGSLRIAFEFADTNFATIGRYHKVGSHVREEAEYFAKKDERLFIKVGDAQYPIHRNSPFQIALQVFADGGSGKDAGEDVLNPLPIQAGEYSENWITHPDDSDFYQMTIKANESYDITVTPQAMDFGIEVKIYDRDRVKKAEDGSANAGAVVRLSNIAPRYDGILYVQVSRRMGLHSGQPGKYSFRIEAKPLPAESVGAVEAQPSAGGGSEKNPLAGTPFAQLGELSEKMEKLSEKYKGQENNPNAEMQMMAESMKLSEETFGGNNQRRTNGARRGRENNDDAMEEAIGRELGKSVRSSVMGGVVKYALYGIFSLIVFVGLLVFLIVVLTKKKKQ